MFWKNKHPLFYLGFCFLLPGFGVTKVNAQAAAIPKFGAIEKESGPEIRFIENKGQWETFIKYKLDFKTGALFLENNRFTYAFVDPAAYEEEDRRHHNLSKSTDDFIIKAHAITVDFIGSNPQANLSAETAFPDYKNYFIGNEREKWANHVLSYEKVNYKNLYQNIDMRIYGKATNLKYDFILKPGADPKLVKYKYQGQDLIYLEKGSLHIKTSVNSFYEQKPYAYQVINGKTVEVPCEFILNDNLVSFNFPAGYNSKKELIIDPTLIFSTYTGSTPTNWGFTATYDNEGNLYAGGFATGLGYPTTTGAFQTTFAGGGSFYGHDVTITKFSDDGAALLYSTYLGGSNNEFPHSLFVTYENELLVFGTTGSSNFPMGTNAYDNSYNGGNSESFDGLPFVNGTDIYVTKFNSDGSALIGSTYVGGSANDGMNNVSVLQGNYGDWARGEIIADEFGECYVASNTLSTDFPTTPGVFQTANAGLQDGCLFKLSDSLDVLMWCTYFGGSGQDAAFSLKKNSIGQIYICGGTTSSDLDSTNGALVPTYQGSTDGFLAKIDSDATILIRTTYIGTSSYDQTYLLETDFDDNFYTVGQSAGSYTVTPGTYSNPGSGQFIHKIGPNLNTTIWATVFGSGSGINISPTAFLVDICENVYVSGWGGGINTTSPFFRGNTFNMPVTLDAHQSGTDGKDFYFIVLGPQASSLVYATYFGENNPGGAGDHVDGGTNRFDRNGLIYESVCAGCFGSDLFPTTLGAWSSNNGSSECNLACFKFDMSLVLNTATTYQLAAENIVEGCLGNVITVSIPYFAFQNDTIHYTIAGTAIHDTDYHIVPNILDYMVIPTGGISGQIFIDAVRDNKAEGTETFCIIFNKVQCSDLFNDTICIDIINVDSLEMEASVDTFLCNGDDVTLTANATGGYGTYYFAWMDRLGQSYSDASITVHIDSSTTYTVNVGDSCGLIATQLINVTVGTYPKIGISLEGDLCTEKIHQLTFTGSASDTANYTWDFGDAQVVSGSGSGPYGLRWLEPGEKQIHLTCGNGICAVDSTITINLVDCPLGVVPNVITPNDDGKNDVFEIHNMDNFPGSRLVIFNRWGMVVYETIDYKNDWDGKNVVDGVYYYLIDLANEDKTKINGTLSVFHH